MENTSIKVLLIEGDLRFARTLQESLSALTTARIELLVSENLAKTQRRLIETRFDAILLDLDLPDSHGLATFASVQTGAPKVPIVVLASYDNEHRALDAVRRGAQDYLVKAKADGKILSRVIRHAIERKRVERRLAAQYAVTRVLAESATLSDATPKILQATCESLEWEMGTLWKVDTQADVLRCVALWHIPTAQLPEFAAVTRQYPFTRGVGLPGRIWASGKPAWIDNVAEDTNFPRAPIAAREGLHGAFGFPVKLDQQILGVIEFFSRQVQQPDEDLLRMMAAIGSQIGQFMVRKETERALAEERNLLRTLIDTLPDAIYVKDTQSRFILGNRGVARLMGAAEVESLVGKKDSDFYPGELAGRYYADEQAVIESGQPLINREEPVIDPTGRQGWFLTTKAPLRDTRGRIVGLVGMGRDITERKRDEQRLRESEALKGAILESALDSIIAMNHEGKVIEWNPAAERTFGYRRSEVVGREMSDLIIPPGLRDQHRHGLARFLSTGEGQVLGKRVEMTARRADGSEFPVELAITVTKLDGLPAFTGCARDITDRKLAEEARNQLAAIVESSNDAIISKTLEGVIVSWNASAERIFGYSAEEVIGRPIALLIPPEHWGEESQIVEKLKRGEGIEHYETVRLRKDGARIDVSLTISPLNDSSGRIIGASKIARDITERKRTEEALRQSEARKGAILETALDAIVTIDRAGRVYEWNPAAEKIFGYRKAEALGRKMDELIIPPSLRERYHNGLAEYLMTGVGSLLGRPIELTVMRLEGTEFRAELAITRNSWDEPTAYTCFIRDITERKLAETKLVEANADLLEMNNELTRSEEDLRKALADVRASHEQLKAAQLQLIQAEKMESIGTLAAGVAHEVKNPLQTILMGLAYLTKNIPVGDETIAMVLSDIRDAVKRADAIVRDLLYLSAPKQLETREEDLNAVIERSLCLVNYELNRSRISVVRELAADLPVVRLDKAKMEQVFINLFMNAIQAMPDGGTLAVRTCARRLGETGQPDGKVHAPFSAGDTVVIAEVQDTGVGIPPDKLRRLFTPFITTKPSGVGTGLGLPVTKQIIDLHGGAIDIALGPSGGVRVTLVLKAESTESHERSHEHETYNPHEQETDSIGRRRNQLYTTA